MSRIRVIFVFVNNSIKKYMRPTVYIAINNTQCIHCQAYHDCLMFISIATKW